ncbi:MAG: polysaccharide biosynthesis/export family protein [Bacteroidia bacterium]
MLVFWLSAFFPLAQNLSPSQIDGFIQQARQMGVSEAEIERMKEAYYNREQAGTGSPAAVPIPSKVDSPKPPVKPMTEKEEKTAGDSQKDTVVIRERYIPPREDVPNIFGHAIFADSAYQALSGNSLSTPLDYIVGPGDEFRVVAYDGASFSAAFTVGSDGAVYSEAYPFLGKLYLAGLTYEQASKTLQSRLQRYLAGSPSIAVTLAPQGREIKVNISGQVRQPGTYSLPASTSAFNALFAAGGINKIGSVRRIQVRRNGKLVQELDLYDFLATGNSPPVYLQDRDFLFVPVQGKIVEVKGKVKQPMMYELKKTSIFLHCSISPADCALTPCANAPRSCACRAANPGLSILNLKHPLAQKKTLPCWMAMWSTLKNSKKKSRIWFRLTERYTIQTTMKFSPETGSQTSLSVQEA